MKNENGMLVVEASIVFPVIFTVVFIMIFYGNACFQQARVQYILEDLALEGASYCADPMLSYVSTNGSVPEYGSEDAAIKPYRYIIGGMKSIEKDIKEKIKTRITGLSSGLFGDMKVEVDWAKNEDRAEFKNYYICSFFVVKLEYEIPISVRLLGADEFFSLKCRSYSEVPVTDTVEFIHNVDMVEDFLQRSEQANKIKDKITEVMDKVKKWFNS